MVGRRKDSSLLAGGRSKKKSIAKPNEIASRQRIDTSASEELIVETRPTAPTALTNREGVY